MAGQLLLLGLLVSALGFTSYEDFRYRGVVWWLFPILCLLFVTWSWAFVFWEEWKWQIVLNIGFLFVQLGLVSLYYSFRQGKWVAITKHLLGVGDVLFMVCTTVLGSLPSFLLFHLGSLSLAILLALLFPSIRSKGVPLAGIQAGVLTILLPVLYFFHYNAFDDSWWLFLFS